MKNILKLKKNLICLGIVLLNGCAGNLECPPFPLPHPVVADELKSITYKTHPYFIEWMGRLYKLYKQLNIN